MITAMTGPALDNILGSNFMESSICARLERACDLVEVLACTSMPASMPLQAIGISSISSLSLRQLASGLLLRRSNEGLKRR